MKRKNLIFNTGKNTDVENYVLNLAEKNDDPDYWLGLVEGNIPTEIFKKRKYEKIELKEEEENSDDNNNNNSETTSSSSSSSISNVISTIIVPAVATVAIASFGLVPGLDSLNSLNISNNVQNNISANIISIDSTDIDAKYNINLDFDTAIDEKFDFNDENVAVSLTNDFVNYEQEMKYNNTGQSAQEYVVGPKNNSNISSKYTIKQNGEGVLNSEEGISKHSFTVDGYFEGLNQNMNYTLSIKSKGKVLARKEFKTKSEEDRPPFEIISTEMKFDTYKDIASFEILINTKNWSNHVKFNDEEFVLRLSNNQNSVDFNIRNDYSYIVKQGIELIYDLSQKDEESGNTMFTLRGDISKLAENTNYTMTLLRKDSKLTENSFETSSIQKGLEIQAETN